MMTVQTGTDAPQSHVNDLPLPHAPNAVSNWPAPAARRLPDTVSHTRPYPLLAHSHSRSSPCSLPQSGRMRAPSRSLPPYLPLS
jgi:hypothetical protein